MRYLCPTQGCKTVKDKPGKCDECKAKQRRASDQRRGSASARGYGVEHRTSRLLVLSRDPYCTCTYNCPGHMARFCPQRSEVADHYPLTRRELVDLGEDPNDPRHMRGLCKRCHDKHTAKTSPGGWHA